MENYTEKDIIDILENRFINSLKTLDYGKSIQCVVQEYVEIVVNKITEEQKLIDPKKNEEIYKKFNYGNNGPGFDILTDTHKRLQVKFRQVTGKTPYSRKTHFSNTRRHSKKNKGNGDSTGMIAYSVNEFDYVLVVLCHIKNGKRTNYKEWSFSLIPNKELVDDSNQLYCLPNIPSKQLNKYKCEDIYMLTKRLKEI